MKIKQGIACMALMISTGYSSLMGPEDFNDNLYSVMRGSYTFKGMGSQEPELTKSFEYYKVVERFVADQFNQNNQELLSLAIAAGRFGVNTEFMWTLYNMASMGVLKVEGRDESYYEVSVSSKTSEEEIIDSEDNDEKVIELIKSDDKPKIEEKQNENNFLENVKHSVKAKLQKVANGNKSLSQLLSEIKTSYELRCLLSEDLVKVLINNSVKDENGNTFKETIKQLEARLFLTDPIIDDFELEYQETVQNIAGKVEEYLKDSKTFYGQLKEFNKDELFFISSNQYYEMYKKAFTLSDLYKGNDQNLDEDNFNKLLVASLKKKIKNMDEKDIGDLEDNIASELNIEDCIKQRRHYFDLIQNIHKSISAFEDQETAKSIAKKIKQYSEGMEEVDAFQQFNKFNINELIFILSEPYSEKYKEAIIGCDKYRTFYGRFQLDYNINHTLFRLLGQKIKNLLKEDLDDLTNEYNEGKLCAEAKDKVGNYIKAQNCYLDLIQNIPESITNSKDQKTAKSIAKKIDNNHYKESERYFEYFGISELTLVASDEFYETYKNAFIGYSLYQQESRYYGEPSRILDENKYNTSLVKALKGYIKHNSGEYIYPSHGYGHEEKKSSEEDLNKLESRCSEILKTNKEMLDAIAERKKTFIK